MRRSSDGFAGGASTGRTGGGGRATLCTAGRDGVVGREIRTASGVTGGAVSRAARETVGRSGGEASVGGGGEAAVGGAGGSASAGGSESGVGSSATGWRERRLRGGAVGGGSSASRIRASRATSGAPR